MRKRLSATMFKPYIADRAFDQDHGTIDGWHELEGHSRAGSILTASLPACLRAEANLPSVVSPISVFDGTGLLVVQDRFKWILNFPSPSLPLVVDPPLPPLLPRRFMCLAFPAGPVPHAEQASRTGRVHSLCPSRRVGCSAYHHLRICCRRSKSLGFQRIPVPCMLPVGLLSVGVWNDTLRRAVGVLSHDLNSSLFSETTRRPRAPCGGLNWQAGDETGRLTAKAESHTSTARRWK